MRGASWPVRSAIKAPRPPPPLNGVRCSPTWKAMAGRSRRAALLTCRARRLTECLAYSQNVDASLPADQPKNPFDQPLLATVHAARHHARGDAPSERASLREAVRLASASPVRSGLLPGTLIHLAETELQLGDAEAAFAATARAESEAATLSVGFRYNSLIGRALLVRSQAELALGRPADARLSLTQALEHLRHTTGADSAPSAEAARQLAAIAG
jgi:hypothetical protein